MGKDSCSCHAHGAQAFTDPVLTPDQTRRLLKYCSTNNCGQSSVLVRALSQFVNDPPAPDAVLGEIAALLGLPRDSDVGAIVAEIQSFDAPPDNPLGDAPPAPPAAAARRTAAKPAPAKTPALSADVARRAAARGLAPAEFIARRSATLAAMRRPR